MGVAPTVGEIRQDLDLKLGSSGTKWRDHTMRVTIKNGNGKEEQLELDEKGNIIATSEQLADPVLQYILAMKMKETDDESKVVTIMPEEVEEAIREMRASKGQNSSFQKMKGA
jgi:hypothetical protein